MVGCRTAGCKTSDLAEEKSAKGCPNLVVGPRINRRAY